MKNTLLKKTSVSRVYHFESAHRLELLPESHKCHNLHGHNYKLIVTYSGFLDERGFVVDFKELDDVVNPFIDIVDHKLLNTIVGLENPTVENIAWWFLLQIDGADTVRVHENDFCWAEVSK